MPQSSALVVELIREMGGYSAPYVARTSDDTYYIVKFQNRMRHARALANELIAGRLGRLLGLPIPDHSIVSVPDALIQGNPHLAATTPSRCYTAGLHFGSRYIGTPERAAVDFLPDPQLCSVSNLRAAFWGGLIFDLWVANCDERGVVFGISCGPNGSRYTAHLVDHELCFAGERWALSDDPPPSSYSRHSVYDGIEGLHSFEPFLSRIEHLEIEEIYRCAQGIPGEWIGGGEQELQRLVQELCDRQKWLRGAILRTRRAYPWLFPSWRLAD